MLSIYNKSVYNNKMTVKFYKIINKIAMINSNGYYQSLSHP